MMKSFPVRSVSALLCGLLLASAAMTACGESAVTSGTEYTPDAPNAESETEAVTEPVKPYLDDLPEDLDLGGYSIRFLTSDIDTFGILEDNGDVVDSAIYARDTKIQDRLNVSLEYITDDTWEGILSDFKKSVTAGSDDYDIYAGYCYWSIVLATGGYLQNLADAEYISLDREYWGKKFIDAMSYKDYIYWLTGDIALSYTSGMYATYVNTRIWYNTYDDEDIYDLVRAGKWTIEDMTRRSRELYHDLNGDSKVDEEDLVGFVYTAEDAIDGLSMACGVKYTEFDANGIPQLYITAHPETAVAFAERLYELCTGEGSLCTTSDDCKSSSTLFASGNVAFLHGRMKNCITYLREMKDDFAVIPLPKLDEAQETYLTTLHDGTTVFGLPKTISDAGRKASLSTLEALAAESYKSLTPAFLDNALKYKYSRDADSADMIDLIRSNIVSDFGYQYTSTGFNNFFRNVCKKDGATVSSNIAKKEASWQKLLDKIIVALEENAT